MRHILDNPFMMSSIWLLGKNDFEHFSFPSLCASVGRKW